MDDKKKTVVQDDPQATPVQDDSNAASLGGLTDGDGYFSEDLAVSETDFDLMGLNDEEDELGLGFSGVDDADDEDAALGDAFDGSDSEE